MRMMVVFEKGAELRYIGHLDLMRAMQRALRRSGLPIKYSNGFNPHIRLSFAAPLSVGVIGLRELMEVPLVEEITQQQFIDAMTKVLPSCLTICKCRIVQDEFPSLMSLVAGSRLKITFPETQESVKAAEAFASFMAQPEVIAIRHTKSGDNPSNIQTFVKSGECIKTDDGYEISLETVATPAGTLKPALWLECLRTFAKAEPFPHMLYRTAILAKAKDGALVPMEEV